MHSFRNVLARRLRHSDEGISLVEVLVAMMIFAIVSVGIVGTLIATSTFARDSRARETATNLAAQAIDAARSTTNVFNLFNDPAHLYTIAGRTYTVNRVAQWVSDPNQVAPCGAGAGALQYKRVNVTVTWPGMTNPAVPVRADTLIAPSMRVSDPADATILVSVNTGLIAGTSAPAGVPGATVTTSPALAPLAGATDVDGCSYLLKVPVGSYTITVTKAGYVGPKQETTQSSGALTVAAGTSVSVPFTMAASKPLTINYASNYAGPDTPARPLTMFTSLVHGTDPAVNAATLPTPLSLYPFSDGYSVYAGNYLPQNTGTQGCLSPNPSLWAAGLVGAVTYAPPTIQPAIPGAGVPASVPMGIVKVQGTAAGQAVSAVSQTTAASGTADPGCASISPVYNFGNVLNASTPKTLALPFGTYTLYYSTTGTGTQVPASKMTVTVPSSTSATNTVTLDPRVAQ
ncbi:MAG: hypothetical protein JWO18_2561 [Microbacteriaceae bacterium]|nr:hypothetical protein [Microbacteriaceae bacterium]